jgi:hypothetical protein
MKPATTRAIARTKSSRSPRTLPSIGSTHHRVSPTGHPTPRAIRAVWFQMGVTDRTQLMGDVASRLRPSSVPRERGSGVFTQPDPHPPRLTRHGTGQHLLSKTLQNQPSKRPGGQLRISRDAGLVRAIVGSLAMSYRVSG